MAQGVDSITYDLIKASLNASTARGKVISNNISNVNTPGFKGSNLNFEENLNSVLKGESTSLRLTNKRHISEDGDSAYLYKVERDDSVSMRQDGNNVDIEKEMVDLSSNNMYYNFLVSRINGKISSQRYVISEGRK